MSVSTPGYRLHHKECVDIIPTSNRVQRTVSQNISYVNLFQDSSFEDNDPAAPQGAAYTATKR